MYIEYISRCGAKTAWFYNFHQETSLSPFRNPKMSKWRKIHRFWKSPCFGWLFDVLLL